MEHPPAPPPCPNDQHNARSAYRRGHRCDPARAWNTRAQTRYQLRRLAAGGGSLLCDPSGTRRRVEALMAVGWPVKEQARRLGITRNALDQIRRSPTVRRTTAARIADLYVELSDVPGPSAFTRGQAAGRGYAPPIAWDDDTIDDPASSPGEWQRTERRYRPVAELDEDVAWLREWGLSEEAIAERLNVQTRTLERVDQRARVA